MKNLYEILKKHGLQCGRMLSGSKSAYWAKYPNDTVVFNANIVCESGKVWHGDLNISKESEKLQKACDEFGGEFLILREMDARFSNEGLKYKVYKTRSVKVFYP